VLDDFGWIGFQVHPASVWRVAGAVLMVIWVGLTAFFTKESSIQIYRFIISFHEAVFFKYLH